MATGIHLTHAAELWTDGDNPGPTGRYVEVLAGEVRDYGGNLLFAGSADECVTAATGTTPTRLVPTKWLAVAADYVEADNVWQMVTESEVSAT